MYRLHIHDDAESDLEGLRKKEPQAAARFIVLFQELESDQDLLDRLTQHNYGSNESADIQISKWFEQWNKGRDIWRLKVWDLEKKGLYYRAIYAYKLGKREYHVLGIVPRDFNYEEQHPLSQRILRAYRAL